MSPGATSGGWQHWRSTVDGVNAWLLRALGSTLDQGRLRRRCKEIKAAAALKTLLRWSKKLGEREPAAEEIEAWARRGP